MDLASKCADETVIDGGGPSDPMKSLLSDTFRVPDPKDKKLKKTMIEGSKYRKNGKCDNDEQNNMY